MVIVCYLWYLAFSLDLLQNVQKGSDFSRKINILFLSSFEGPPWPRGLMCRSSTLNDLPLTANVVGSGLVRIENIFEKVSSYLWKDGFSTKSELF